MAPEPAASDPKAAAPRRRRPWLLRVVLALVLLPVVLVLAAVCSLYIPGVLDYVASKALPSVEQSTGMKIDVDRISLRFPLRLRLEGALVLAPESADTMVAVRRFDASVNPLELVRGRIGITSAEALGAFYQMGAADSLYVGARVDTLSVDDADMTFSLSSINVGSARLAGGRVKLLMGTGGSEKTDTAPSSTDMVIAATRIELARVDYAMNMARYVGADSDYIATDTIAASIAHARLGMGRLHITPDSISIDCRDFTVDAPSALYGLADAEPQPGLDLNWLSLDSTAIEVSDFAMRGTDMTVPIMLLRTRERCGLLLNVNGIFAMDSAGLHATDFIVATGNSTLTLSADLGLDSVASLAPVSLDARASIGLADVSAALPQLAPVLAPMPSDVPLQLRALASGTMAQLSVDTLSARMERIFAMNIAGEAANLTDPDRLLADLAISGSLTDPGPVRRMVSGVRIPPLSLGGHVKASGSSYAANLSARTGAGRLALDATYSGAAPDYSLRLRADSLPVGAFMPDLGVGAITASVTARGHGFNVWSPATSIAANVDLRRAQYLRSVIHDVTLDARLSRGEYSATLTSGTPAAAVNLSADGHLSRRDVTWRLDAGVRSLDLKSLGLTDSVMQGSMDIISAGRMDPLGDSIAATASIRNLDWWQGQAHLKTDSIRATLVGSPSQVAATLSNRTLDLTADADTSFTALLTSISTVGAEAARQVESRSVHADSLHMALPQMRISLDAGADNLINDFLRPSALSFRGLRVRVANDSTLHASANVLGLLSGKDLRIDTVNMTLAQRDSALTLAANMHNRPGTFDEFARVGIRAGMAGNVAHAYIRQRNINDQVGYSLGFESTVTDSLISLSFTPLDAVIAYKKWTFNEGNYVAVDPRTYRINADLDASGAGSRVRLFSSRDAEADSSGLSDDVVTLKVSDVRLQDWLSINPFAPPIEGSVSADMKFRYNTSRLNGSGDVNLVNLTYGKERVGDFDLAVDLATNRAGVINADVALMVDSIKTITAIGSLNDSTKASPFMLDFSMIRLPLRVANPFLPPSVARLSGMLNGNMEITGTLAHPVFNGYLDFDSAAVKVGMIGSGFTFSDVKVPVDSNVVRFSDFAITGSNRNPLLINGTVDMQSLSSPLIDLRLNARNMMAVNSKKRKGVDVYGKAYLDIDATVKGNLNFLAVDASLAVLPQTDVSYIMSSTESQIGLQNTDEMVRFVNFNDTAAVLMADSAVVNSSMQMMLTAKLDVRQGSTFTVDLSSDGKNRAQIKGDGVLNYTQTPLQAEGRLTGRFNINDGFVRYSLPVISEKNFKFNQGSFVSFNGPIANPTLNVTAVDQIRANVTEQGANSRLVYFDVILSATGTLEHLNVAFDLSTNDDLSVQNELQSMSPAQRANQAMNLLLYNVYTGPNTSATANLSGNALYSFLTSQLNSWAANNIKGVDLSFGMDQYDSTRDGSTSTATQYSYKVSKSLFNNRFKIVVGGNYSTDASSDENLSQNLISDISFEYLLNDAGSMYVRLFRHTGYESILEGEITQTGVGFVLKRRLDSLRDLFRRRRSIVNPIMLPSNGANQ